MEYDKKEALAALRFMIANDSSLFRCERGVADTDIYALDIAIAHAREIALQASRKNKLVRTERTAFEFLTT